MRVTRAATRLDVCYYYYCCCIKSANQKTESRVVINFLQTVWHKYSRREWKRKRGKLSCEGKKIIDLLTWQPVCAPFYARLDRHPPSSQGIWSSTFPPPTLLTVSQSLHVLCSASISTSGPYRSARYRCYIINALLIWLQRPDTQQEASVCVWSRESNRVTTRRAAAASSAWLMPCVQL